MPALKPKSVCFYTQRNKQIFFSKENCGFKDAEKHEYLSLQKKINLQLSTSNVSIELYYLVKILQYLFFLFQKTTLLFKENMTMGDCLIVLIWKVKKKAMWCCFKLWVICWGSKIKHVKTFSIINKEFWFSLLTFPLYGPFTQSWKIKIIRKLRPDKYSQTMWFSSHTVKLSHRKLKSKLKSLITN